MLPYIRRLFQKPFSFEAMMKPKWPERLKQNTRFSISSWSKAEMLIIEIRKKTDHNSFISSTKDNLLVFWIHFLSGLYFSKRMHIYCGLWKLRDLLTLNGHYRYNFRHFKQVKCKYFDNICYVNWNLQAIYFYDI